MDKTKKLEQLARSGEIAKAVLKNKNAIARSGGKGIPLIELPGKNYNHNGDLSDSHGFYDSTKDERVDRDPVLIYLSCFSWVCNTAIKHLSSMDDRRIISNSPDAEADLTLGAFCSWGHEGDDYLSIFERKLLDRSMTQEEYLEPVVYSPAVLLARANSRDCNHSKKRPKSNYPNELNEILLRHINQEQISRLKQVAKEQGVVLFGGKSL